MVQENLSNVPRREGFCIKVYTQNSRGLRATNLEEVLATMKTQSVFAWCLQETWRIGSPILKYEGGYHCIYHGPTEKLNRRGSLGVAIMLDPQAWQGYLDGGQKRKCYGLRIMAITIKLTDVKGKVISIRLVTAYAPHSGCTDKEKTLYENNLELAIKSCGEDQILVVGTDANASLSRLKTEQVQDQDKDIQSPVGKFGLDWTNAAGERMETFLRTHDMCLPTTFFEKHPLSYATWYHNANKKGYQIDHFMLYRKDLKRVRDAGSTVCHSIASDHNAVYIKLRIARNLAKQKSKNDGKRILRSGLQDPVIYTNFVSDVNKRLIEIDSRLGTVSSNGRINNGWRLKKRDDGTTQSIQETFQEILTNAAKKHLTATSRVNPGWFVANQPALMESCRKRNSLQQHYNQNPNNNTKRKLRIHQNVHKRLVYQSKQDWTMKRVSKINGSGGSYIGHYWKAVKDLVKGHDTSEKVTPLMFRNPETNEKCKTEKGVGKVLVNHLDKLLNAIPKVEEEAINSVKQRKMQTDLNVPPSKEEIITAIRRQNNNKATGDSKVPAEFYKTCINDPVLFKVIQMILVRAWEFEEIPKEWIEGRIKMLPKSGDLLDPGRWRSITLLDAVAKIMSTILTYRLNKILKLDGLEMQNGFTPGRGTVDGSFCVRTLLKKRKEHGLETYGYFLDLVKAFDTVPRESLLRVLAKFGVPPKMVQMIENMYTNCIVKVEVGKDEFVINATAGVKQGDNLAPVLFLIYIQAVLETLDEKFPQRNKLVFATKFDHIIHGRNYKVKKGVKVFEIGESLYADDAYFGFGTRKELEQGAVIIDRHFTAFGLQVHRGKYLPNGKRKKSKTECMYCPAQGSYEDGDTSDVMVDNGFYSFTNTFKYLGSIITYDLSADADVAARIRSASGAFAKLKKTLLCKRTKLIQRSAIYVVIVLSILLYGSETWACREDLLRKLETFHNSCVRQMCHVSKYAQRFQKIKTKTLNKRVGLTPVREMITARQLRWAGHVARMENDRGPRMLLTGYVQHPRPGGRPLQSFGHSLKKCLKSRAESMTKKELEQTLDIQLDPNIDKLTRITGFELRDALLRTHKPVKKRCLTWIDLTRDRDIWRMIVLNNFTIKPVIHERAHYWDIINRIVPIPRRPERTKENQRNKLPKLYAIWFGAPKPGLRPRRLTTIVDSWIKCKPMVFGVSGAQYISATNNAAGLRHLKDWLWCHELHPLRDREKVSLRKDGIRYIVPAGIGKKKEKKRK